MSNFMSIHQMQLLVGPAKTFHWMSKERQEDIRKYRVIKNWEINRG